MPMSICQSPFEGTSLASFNKPAGEQWEQAGLTVIPYELTRGMIEAFFENNFSPIPTVRQDLFFNDFKTGNQQYCPSALVRILCCLGCRITGAYDATLSYHAGMAGRLFGEALHEIKSSEGALCNITNAHALGLMSLHQLAVGENDHAQELAEEGVRRLNMMRRQPSGDDEASRLLQSVQAPTLVGAVTLAR